MSNKLYVTSHDDWTEEKLRLAWGEIQTIASEELELNEGIDYYPNQFEIVSSEQMIDAYASIGMPIMYNHWSFGKDFLRTQKSYAAGRQGLALEMVINSNPTINYLMEENSLVDQIMVLAHAGIGHNAVFKNNEGFKQWTNASSIVDYMSFARNFIAQCEQRYGMEEVEVLLDAAHALAPHGVDKFKRKHKPKVSDEARLQKLIEKDNQDQRELDIVLKKTKIKQEEVEEEVDYDEDQDNEENLLYYIMKKSPNLDNWKREIIRIVYKVHQYFYPQGQCVTGDNLVATGNGLIRLDELITQDGYVPNDKIQLLTEGDRFTSISHTYVKRKAKVVKVKTASGREFIGTPEHPLMTLDGLDHDLKNLGKMQVGDHLVFRPDYQNVLSTKEVELKPLILNDEVTCNICGFTSEFLPTHITQTHGISTVDYDGELSADTHRANKSANMPSKYPATLNAEIGELVAYLQNMTLPSGLTSVFPFNADSTMQKRFTDILESQFGIVVDTTSFSSWGLRKFIEQNIKFDRAVPLCIRKSPKHVVIAYLKALFDYRGVSRTDISSFKYRTYDYVAVQQLQSLLIGLGIVSSISFEHFTTYAGLCEAMGMDVPEDKRLEASVFCLQILPSYKEKFEEVIGSNLNLPTFEGNVRVASKDLIPGAKALLDEVINYVSDKRESHVISTKGMWYAEKKRSGLLLKDQAIPKLDDLPLIRAEEISFEDVKRDEAGFKVACSQDCEASVKLSHLLSTSKGCYYDRVVSVEELEELHDVYDVTVPENHLFWMSGLISHNTKNLNEGFASFCHYYIMTRLEEKGILSPDAYISFLNSHAGVIFQPEYSKKYYNGINPYTLGFNILMDVKRICENPTQEDKEWFPNLIGKRWIDAIKEATFEHRDDSFVMQYLSPKVIRDMKLFSVNVTEDKKGRKAIVSDIHDEVGYRQVRTNLARSFERVNRVPQIRVLGSDLEGDRTLYLEYVPYRGRRLDHDSAELVAEYIDHLWGYNVVIEDDAEEKTK